MRRDRRRARDVECRRLALETLGPEALRHGADVEWSRPLLLPAFGAYPPLPLTITRTGNHLRITSIERWQVLQLVWTKNRWGKPAWASVICPRRGCGRHARVLYTDWGASEPWRCRWCHPFKYASAYPLQPVARARARLLRIEQQFGTTALPEQAQQARAAALESLKDCEDIAQSIDFLRSLRKGMGRKFRADMNRELPYLDPLLRQLKGKRFR